MKLTLVFEIFKPSPPSKLSLFTTPSTLSRLSFPESPFMMSLAFVVRVCARLVELVAETPAKNPYVAEMYKLSLEGKLYSRSIP
jgi:hypothetical protein